MSLRYIDRQSGASHHVQTTTWASAEVPDRAILQDVTLLLPGSGVPGPIAAFSFAPDLAGHWEWFPPPYDEDDADGVE